MSPPSPLWLPFRGKLTKIPFMLFCHFLPFSPQPSQTASPAPTPITQNSVETSLAKAANRLRFSTTIIASCLIQFLNNIQNTLSSFGFCDHIQARFFSYLYIFYPMYILSGWSNLVLWVKYICILVTSKYIHLWLRCSFERWDWISSRLTCAHSCLKLIQRKIGSVPSLHAC